MSELSLISVLKAMNTKNKCKVGVWLEIQEPALLDDIDKTIKEGVALNTIYRAVKFVSKVEFSDKTWARHYQGNCSC